MQKTQPHSFIRFGLWLATRIQVEPRDQSEENRWKPNPEIKTISQVTLNSQP
jgi:hypothetical protein